MDEMEARGRIPPGLPMNNPIQSYWQDPPDEISDHGAHEPLPEEADIVIIGSGISGSTIAYNLLKDSRDLKVVMLEARQAASGASGRNGNVRGELATVSNESHGVGGHTKTASYRSFKENLDLVGDVDAIKIAQLEYDCMVAVHDFAKDHGIACDSIRCDTVDVFYDEAQWKSAHESVRLMKASIKHPFIEKYKFWDANETAERYAAPDTFGSLTYEAGSLSAYKFTIGVLKLALSRGLKLYCKTPVKAISSSSQNGFWTIESSRGTLKARKVVLATNGYTAHLYPETQGVIVPFRGIITAQRPGSRLPQTGLDYTYSYIYENGYEYMITRPRGSKFEGDIVIGGGLVKGNSGGVEEYGNTDDTVLDHDIVKYLEECTVDYFGSNWGKDHKEGRVRKAWSGIMGYAADSYPFIGPAPGKKGLYLDASFQGHGMVLCFLCAKAASDMILGRDGEDLKTWFPDCFRISEERLKHRFSGRLHAPKPNEKQQLAE